MTSDEGVPGVRRLQDGLELRPAHPQDLEQIGALLVERGEEHDALDHRLVVQDPRAGWQVCAVVADGERIVSTATLLDEELQLDAPGPAGPVSLPAGQVELVATDVEYEGRGLVRALMGWAHDLSSARGHVVQVMIGIPSFYRQFGYSYAIDIAARRRLKRDVPAPADGATVRAAGRADLPAITALQDRAQAASDLRMPHSPPRLQWLLDHEASTTWVVERGGRVVGTGRTTPPDDGVLLAELAGVDRNAVLALVGHADRLARSAGDDAGPLRLADRPGTVAGDVVDELCAAPSPEAEQYYVRVPDAVALLDTLRPVLQARLSAAGLVPDSDVVVSSFRRHVRFPVTDGHLGAPVAGGPMQSPGSVGGAGVAPDLLGPLLFGPLGIEGLSRRHPDVYPGRHAELMTALFPPLTADLLTYYLP